MKTPQAYSVIRSIVVVAALILAASPGWSGPPQITSFQLAAMEPMDPSAIPTFGNFWYLIGPDPGQPWPPLPGLPRFLPEGAQVYQVDEGQFVINDEGWDWDGIRQQVEMDSALRRLERQYGLNSEEEEEPPPEEPSPGYPEGSLWLFLGQITNGDAPLTICGTVPDGLYEIQSEPGPADGAWVSQGVVLGASNQSWTPTTLAVGDVTNSLFFRAVYWPDCDGSGTPAAWYVQHGLYPLAEGIASQDANLDGLLNSQEYLWGSDPQAAAVFGVWVSSPAGYSGIP